MVTLIIMVAKIIMLAMVIVVMTGQTGQTKLTLKLDFPAMFLIYSFSNFQDF